MRHSALGVVAALAGAEVLDEREGVVDLPAEETRQPACARTIETVRDGALSLRKRNAKRPQTVAVKKATPEMM